MWHLKTTTEKVKVGALVIIKKEPDNHFIKMSGSPSLYEIQKKKMHFAEQLISQGEYYQCDWKI